MRNTNIYPTLNAQSFLNTFLLNKTSLNVYTIYFSLHIIKNIKFKICNPSFILKFA